MESWITITPDLRQGLKIASRIDNGKFRLLVNRICQNLSSDGKPFSEEEEEKLLISLELNKEELTFLLDAVTLIYKQAAFNIVKPATFESVLKGTCHLDEDKTLVFVNSWLTYGKGIIKDLRKRSIFPKQVKDINWCLNIQSSSSTISKDANPVALFQLDFTGIVSNISGDRRTKSRVLQTTRTTTIIIKNKIIAVKAPTIHPSFSSIKSKKKLVTFYE